MNKYVKFELLSAVACGLHEVVWTGFGQPVVRQQNPKAFAFLSAVLQAGAMIQPLALVLYEKLLPGSQLVNRLQDLGYRVSTAPGTEALTACAEQEKPLVVLVDLVSTKGRVADAIGQLRKNAATGHLPVIAFADEKEKELQTAAQEAGATLVVNEPAIMSHLEQFLERALQLDQP